MATLPSPTNPPTDTLIAAFAAHGFTPHLGNPTYQEFSDGHGTQVALFAEVGRGFWNAYLYNEDTYTTARIPFTDPTPTTLLGSLT